MFKRKRLVAFLLVFALLLPQTTALAAGVIPEPTLEEIYNEAKANYEVSTCTYGMNNVLPMIYEEQELENGNILVITGYPTDHFADETVLDDNEQEETYIIRATETGYDDVETKSGLGWYMRSTVRWYEQRNDSTGVLYKSLSRYSYNLTVNSGYELQARFEGNTKKIQIFYQAVDLETSDVNASRYLYLNETSVSNMPASAISSLWVADEIESVLGVRYAFYISGNFYYLDHMIIGNMIDG